MDSMYEITNEPGSFLTTCKDIQHEILLKLPYTDIIQFCSTSKHSCNNNLWASLIKRDFLFDFVGDGNAKNLYESHVKLFDKHVTTIIAKCIKWKTKIINLKYVYDGIYQCLVNCFYQMSNIDCVEDAKNKFIQRHTLELNAYYEICDFLTIIKPAGINADISRTHRILTTESDKINRINGIFSSAYYEYIMLQMYNSKMHEQD